MGYAGPVSWTPTAKGVELSSLVHALARVRSDQPRTSSCPPFRAAVVAWAQRDTGPVGTRVPHLVRHPVGYALTRSPDAADLSMAAMTSWRRTASAKSGT